MCVSIYRKTPSQEDTWIGLYQTTGENSDLQWIDGTTPFVFRNSSFYQAWKSGNPDGGTQGCVHVEENNNYLWVDDFCSRSHWAVCEKSPITTGNFFG